ncbi:MAG: EAL domain-containing protein [Polaromonas sp.]|nr:EAL domain-containing protein [Polaromonas sp.]
MTSNPPAISPSAAEAGAAGASMAPLPEPDFDGLVQLAATVCGTRAAVLQLVDDEAPASSWSVGLPEVVAGLTDFYARVLQAGGKPLTIPDAAADPGLSRHPMVAGPPGLRFFAAVPLIAADGTPLGVLAVMDSAVRTGRDADLSALDMLGRLVVAQLDLRRQQQRLADRNAEQEQQNQRRLQIAMRTAQMSSWALDLADNSLTLPPEFAAMLGTGTAMPGTLDELLQHYAAESRTRIRQVITECARNAAPFDEEAQILTAPDGRRWVRMIGEVVRGTSGAVTRIQGILQDINARKQAQEETLRLAMRLTTTLASITEAFVTLDREGRFTYLNQESERLLQHSTAELLGQEIWQDFGEEVSGRLRQHIQRALTTNRQVEFENFFPPLGKWLEVRAYPFAEGLAVYFRDVSERRNSQEQLMLLETGIARLNDIVVIVEASPRHGSGPQIVFVNDAFERHTGYTREEVLSRMPGMLQGPETREDELARIFGALQQWKQARGELVIYRKDGESFWVDLEIVSVAAQNGDLTHWVAVGRDITQRKAADEKIHHLAFYDPLTELPNRQLLLERLEQALEDCASTRQEGVLMFIDLDNFKILNDTLGHSKGDLLLQKVAVRLKGCVRKLDTVARLGGDEFVVMLQDLGTQPEAATRKAQIVAEKVLATLREPYDLAGYQHYSTSSIGVTPFNIRQGSVSELLKQADLAMYQAKTMGRNTVCFFDPDMQASVSANAALSTDLRAGLREHQFLVHYQPQVDREQRITGVEALLRWKHPQRGMVSPAEFIPVAEESGLILPLGQWVLEQACLQLAVWQKQPETAGLSIAVNVSVRQFRHPDFVDMVMAAIKHSGIQPHNLKLELTESLLADRMEIAIAKMGTLKALGVTLALDDFGMGYSSLSYLKRLPLDQLKIDKSFIADVFSDPNDAAICSAIISLAQSLGLDVIAEGVETEAQRSFLAGLGCGYYQGFLFCPPLPIAEFETFMRGAAT